MPTPTPPQPAPTLDKAALAFIAVLAVMLVLGGALLLRALGQRGTEARDAAPAAAAWQAQLQGAVDELAALLRRHGEAGSNSPRPAPAPEAAAKPAAPPVASAAPMATPGDPARVYPSIAAPAAPHVRAIPVNSTWTYDVSFGPSWSKGGQLHYRTLPQAQGKLGANMSWTPNGAQPTTWFLGIVEPDHASHANTRFPGFFMHASYLPQTLAPNARLLWEMPWQGVAGGVRRYDVRVVGWERLSLPAGSYDAVRLEGTLRYVQSDSVKAEVAYTLWYAPAAKQTVRLRWMGRAPDEGATEMLAELAALRLQ